MHLITKLRLYWATRRALKTYYIDPENPPLQIYKLVVPTTLAGDKWFWRVSIWNTNDTFEGQRVFNRPWSLTELGSSYDGYVSNYCKTQQEAEEQAKYVYSYFQTCWPSIVFIANHLDYAS